MDEITVFFSKEGSIYLFKNKYHYLKTIHTKNELYNKIQDEFNKGHITEITEDDNSFIFVNSKENRKYTIDKSDIKDVEIEILRKLVVKIKEQEIIDKINEFKEKQNSALGRFIKNLKKTYRLKITENDVKGIIFNSLITVTIVNSTFLATGKMPLNIFMINALFGLNLYYVMYPAIRSLIVTKNELADAKYDLSLEEYNNLMNEKELLKNAKTKKEAKKLLKAKKELERINNIEVPDIKSNIVKELRELKESIINIKNETIRDKDLSEFYTLIDKYEEIIINSNTDEGDALILMDENSKIMKYCLELDTFKRKINNDISNDMISNEINDLRQEKVCSEVCEDVSDNLDEGNALTLKRK